MTSSYDQVELAPYQPWPEISISGASSSCVGSFHDEDPFRGDSRPVDQWSESFIGYRAHDAFQMPPMWQQDMFDESFTRVSFPDMQ